MTEEQQRRPDTAQGQWTGLDDVDDVDDDRTNEMDRDILPTGELPELIRDESRPVRRIRPIRFTIKVLLLIVIVVFGVYSSPALKLIDLSIQDLNRAGIFRIVTSEVQR